MYFGNASNNTNAISLLKMHLNLSLADVIHVKCTCYIYNLIVKCDLDLFKPEITLVSWYYSRK